MIKTARLQLEVLDLLPDNENTLFSDVADEQMSLLQVPRAAVPWGFGIIRGARD